MEIKPIETIDGISVGNKLVLQFLSNSIGLASSIAAALPSPISRELQRIVMLSAVHTVNSLLAASSSQCMLAVPPAEIDMVTDTSGGLILRCKHTTPHRWKLDGTKI